MNWRSVSNISIKDFCDTLIKEGNYTLTENENDPYLRYHNCNFSTSLFVVSSNEDSDPYLMRLIQDSETGTTYLLDDIGDQFQDSNYVFPLGTKVLILEHKVPKLKKRSLPKSERQ